MINDFVLDFDEEDTFEALNFEDNSAEQKRRTFWKKFHFVGDICFLCVKRADKFLKNKKSEDINYLVRLRSGFIVDITDSMEVGFRFIAQNTSLIDSIKNIDCYHMGKIGFDRSYFKFKFAEKGTFVAGVFANPFFSTNLIFDEKMVFNGLAEGFTSSKEYANFYYILGQFPLEKNKKKETTDENWKNEKKKEEESDTKNESVDIGDGRSFLWAGQTGCIIDITEDVEMELAVSYFVFTNLLGKKIFEKDRSSLFSLINFYSQNDKYINGYKIINFIAQIQFYMNKLPTTILINVLKNFGESLHTHPSQFKNFAYEMLISCGRLEDFLSQKFTFTHRYVEPCSVLDAFAGRDFTNFGTNYKGWQLKWSVNMTTSICLNISFSSLRTLFSIENTSLNEETSSSDDKSDSLNDESGSEGDDFNKNKNKNFFKPKSNSIKMSVSVKF